jgi:phosphatidylserine/phosphatidylglycerophosphate/cardiolipin synthase-like enzyme
VQNPSMQSDAPDAPGDRATDRPADDPAIAPWFLADHELPDRARAFTTGNVVVPLVDGREYFARLNVVLTSTQAGDQVFLLGLRSDVDERLAGAGTEVGEVLGGAARRGVRVFGLVWRSHSSRVHLFAESNAAFVRRVDADGGHVLLDSRIRRAGSHHQKLVVVRHPRTPARDVAFVGGIDLGYSRNDDSEHLGDPQAVDLPGAYGPRPPWHDLQVEVRGPAVDDLESTFRERWDGSSVLGTAELIRRLSERTYHLGAMSRRALPAPTPEQHPGPGGHAVQVLRTYPARIVPYPFAPHGERSIAHAYRKAFARARSLVYLEDQYLWSLPVADVVAAALRANPDLRVIAVVPRFPDSDEALVRVPGVLARHEAMRACAIAGGERFAVYDLENSAGTPVYVHAKVVVVDDVWAKVGSDNLNRRSWSHDSELSVAVLDSRLDPRAPRDPAGLGDGARTFARDLRLMLWREHLDRREDDVADLLDPREAFAAFRRQADDLDAWSEGGGTGTRPPGRVRVHRPGEVTAVERLWAAPLYRAVHDPDGRALRDRLRGRF